MTDAIEHILLCDGCAAETGHNDEAHAIPPGTLLEDAGCQRCGAILVGFAYRVPADSFTSMSPSTGAADLDEDA